MPEDPKGPPDVTLVLRNLEDKEEILRIFNSWDPPRIVAVLPHLVSTGQSGEQMKALRDAGGAIIDSKLTREIVTTMERLDRSASKLATVGIILTVVVGIAGIVVSLLVAR